MSHIQRLPAKPLFGELAKTEIDNLETKQIWSQRLLYLLKTPLASVDLSKIVGIKDLQDTYHIEGMTLGDLIHLQQIIKAANGDTRAYKAIDAVVANVKEITKTSNLADPLAKMVDMLYTATSAARKEAEADDMFSEDNIIEVDISDTPDDQSEE